MISYLFLVFVALLRIVFSIIIFLPLMVTLCVLYVAVTVGKVAFELIMMAAIIFFGVFYSIFIGDTRVRVQECLKVLKEEFIHGKRNIGIFLAFPFKRIMLAIKSLKRSK